MANQDPSQSADGLTLLPSEKKLRKLGFTDRDPEIWYFSAHLATDISFTVRVSKKIDETHLPEGLHPYQELILDNSFGQPAPLGAMSQEFRGEVLKRLIEELRRLRAAGITISVDPAQYYWEEWTSIKLTGHDGEELIAAAQNAAEVVAEPAELRLIELSTAEAQVPLGITADDLKRIADLIDSEIENLSWDSLAHSMTAGQYVAPTVIRAYLKLLKETDMSLR